MYGAHSKAKKSMASVKKFSLGHKIKRAAAAKAQKAKKKASQAAAAKRKKHSANESLKKRHNQQVMSQRKKAAAKKKAANPFNRKKVGPATSTYKRVGKKPASKPKTAKRGYSKR